MCAYTGEGPESDQIWTQNQKKQDETRKNFHMLRDLNYPKGTTLSLRPPVFVYPHVFFPPNKHFVTTFHLCWNFFLQSRQARALQLATGPWGLVAKIQCSHCHSLASVSGQGNWYSASSCLRLRPPEINALHTLTVLHPLFKFSTQSMKYNAVMTTHFTHRG